MLASLVLVAASTAPAGFYLCAIGGSSNSPCANISDAVGPAAAPVVTSDRVILITTYFGAMPCIGCLHQPELWCNGGIPQLANLTLHKERMDKDLAARVDPSFDGVITLDYESWWPKWNLTKEEYRNASRALARATLPAGAADAIVEARAIADYDAAALNFFVQTVRNTQRWAPLARVGFYGFPTAPWWGYNASFMSQMNEALLPLWNVSSALQPSLYLPYKDNLGTRDYILHRLAQADDVNRLLASAGIPTKPVLPYAWAHYHEGTPAALHFLDDNDTACEFFLPELFTKAAGLIIWGFVPANVSAFDQEVAYFSRHTEWFRDGAALSCPTRSPALSLHTTAAAATPATLAEHNVATTAPPHAPQHAPQHAPWHAPWHGSVSPWATHAKVDPQGAHQYGADRYGADLHGAHPYGVDPYGPIPPFQKCSL